MNERAPAAIGFALEFNESVVADNAADEGRGYAGVARHASSITGFDVGAKS